MALSTPAADAEIHRAERLPRAHLPDEAPWRRREGRPCRVAEDDAELFSSGLRKLVILAPQDNVVPNRARETVARCRHLAKPADNGFAETELVIVDDVEVEADPASVTMARTVVASSVIVT